MSKAILGAVEIGAAFAATAWVGGIGGLAALSAQGGMLGVYATATFGLAASGIATEAGAIAGALGSNQGIGITTRQSAASRQIIYGVQRVGGTIVYCSTTGSTHRQYNMVIVLATHVCETIQDLYLDGRQVFWNTSSAYNKTVSGYNFGGDADGSNHTGPNGMQYNFGGKVFCAAFYGDQTPDPTVVGGVWVGPSSKAGFCSALQANDPTWSPDVSGTPYLAGCTYLYLKLEADSGTFPQLPEIRVTIRGKNNIWDPRTSTRGYSSNWALIAADVLTDSTFGLGEQVNQAQLIAAANVCDEAVTCAAGFENRYALNYHFDTSKAPGDALQEMMTAAAGRLSRVGGEYFIWPAYWQGPSFSFDAGALLDTIQWSPKRSLADLFNRVTGTYTAPNFPYNLAGNLYDSNGYFMGMTANNFPYGFQPTNFPQYAADVLHGYGEDVYLIEDTPNSGAYDSGTAYAQGVVVIYGGVPWRSNEAVPAGHAPGTLDGGGAPYWAPVGNYLPREVSMTGVLSVSQAQRVAKIMLLRNRQQGSGQLAMNLSAFQMMPVDVMSLTIPELGWVNKQLEVAAPSGDWAIKLTAGKPPRDDGGDGEDASAPAIWVQVRVQETDASVYNWDPAEELTPYDIPAISGGADVFLVQPPTAATALSDLTTALVQPNGDVTPRIQLIWTEPADTYVTNGGSIEVEMCAHSSAAWQGVAFVGGQTTSIFLGNVVMDNAYDVRLRSIRSSGAQSAWLEIDNVVAGYAASASGLATVAPSGTLSAVLTGTTSSILVRPFTAGWAGRAAAVSAGSIAGQALGVSFYVYYQDSAFAGGTVTFVATTNSADFLGLAGYFLVGSITTPTGTTPGTRLEPSAFLDLGTMVTSAPGIVYGDYRGPLGGSYPPSYLPMLQSYWDSGSSTTGFGQVLYQGFPAGTSVSGQKLYIVLESDATFTTGYPRVSLPTNWLVTACLGGGQQPTGQFGTLNARGAWAATTAYAQWDTFTQGGLTYLVVTGYTSGGSFGSTDQADTCVILAQGTDVAALATSSISLPTGTSFAGMTVMLTLNRPSTDGMFIMHIGGAGLFLYIQ